MNEQMPMADEKYKKLLGGFSLCQIEFTQAPIILNRPIWWLGNTYTLTMTLEKATEHMVAVAGTAGAVCIQCESESLNMKIVVRDGRRLIDIRIAGAQQFFNFLPEPAHTLIQRLFGIRVAMITRAGAPAIYEWITDDEWEERPTVD